MIHANMELNRSAFQIFFTLHKFNTHVKSLSLSNNCNENERSNNSLLHKALKEGPTLLINIHYRKNKHICLNCYVGIHIFTK